MRIPILRPCALLTGLLTTLTGWGTAQVEAEPPRRVQEPQRIWLPPKPHDPGLAARLAELKRRRWVDLGVVERPLAELVVAVRKAFGVEVALSGAVGKQRISFEFRGVLSPMNCLSRLAEARDLYAELAPGGSLRLMSAAENQRRLALSRAPARVPLAAQAYFPQLEMRLVAVAEKGRLAVDLAAEKGRLMRWLDRDENRARVLADPGQLLRFHGLKATDGGRKSRQIRWFPRWLRARDGERFDFSLAMLPRPSFQAATLKLFDDERHRVGPRTKADRLLELVAVNMKARGFHTLDLDWESLRKERRPRGPVVLSYRFKKPVAGIYSDLSARNIGRGMAVIVDGELVTAPIFMSRIAGAGQIQGLPEAQIDRILRALDK